MTSVTRLPARDVTGALVAASTGSTTAAWTVVLTSRTSRKRMSNSSVAGDLKDSCYHSTTIYVANLFQGTPQSTYDIYADVQSNVYTSVDDQVYAAFSALQVEEN